MLLPTPFSCLWPNVLLSSRQSLRPGVKPAGSESADSEASALAEKFIESSLEDRFAMAKKWLTRKIATADRELFRRVLDHIERILYAAETRDCTQRRHHQDFP